MAELIPFGSTVSIPYSDNFTADEYAAIIQGFQPREMEDKWVIVFEAPFLNLYRSWTGMAVYQIKIEASGSAFSVTEAMADEGIVESQSAEYSAAVADFLTSNLLLKKGKPFPKPSDLADDRSGVLQHHIAGSGFPEVIHIAGNQKKPWWKFW